MTYYTVTSIFLFFLGILVYKFWHYSRNDLLVNKEILQSLEKLNKSIKEQKTSVSSISIQLLGMINLLGDISKNTDIFNKQN